MPYEPRPSATVKEILFDPRNMAIVFIGGICGGLLVYALIFIGSWMLFVYTGWDITPYFRV
jgi:dihydroorotate dehydrogenase